MRTNTIEAAADRLAFTQGDRMAKAMRAADVTRTDMAEYLGVSPTTIGNYTADRTPVKKQTMRLWAMRTGVPLEWLEHGTVGLGGFEPPASTVEYERLADVLPFARKAA